MSYLRAVSLCALAFVVGCIPPKQQVQSADDVGTAAPAPSAGLSCAQISDCFKPCGDDEACITNCRNSGTPQAQAKMTALLDCTTNVCQNDGACTGTTCRSQIDTCVADAQIASSGGSSSGAQQPHSTDNILGWMTGAWIGNNHQFTFGADGTVRRASGTPMYTERGNYACVNLVNEYGTARQEGDLIIMTFPSSHEDSCHETVERPEVVVRYRITWYDNVYDNDPYLQLILVDIDCTKGAMWCDDALNRR